MKCTNCGASMDNGALFCPICGTKVEAANPSANPTDTGAVPNFTQANPIPPTGDGSVSGNDDKKKRMALICIIVVAVLIVLLILRVIFSGIGGGANSAKRAAKDFIEALDDQDASDIMDLVPDEYLDNLMDEYDLSKKEVEESVEDALEELYEEENYSISIKKFKDTEDMDEDKLENIEDGLDLEKTVKEGVTYEIKVQTKIDGEKDTQTLTLDLFKYSGSWYSYDACELVEEAVWWCY